MSKETGTNYKMVAYKKIVDKIPIGVYYKRIANSNFSYTEK